MKNLKSADHKVMKTINKTILSLLLSLNIIGLQSALASGVTRTEFNVFKNKVSFELPGDWQTVNKEVGIPLKLLGPLYENRRPVILFVPIDLKDEKLILDDKKKAEDSYKLGRLAWLQTFNGKTISFLPLKEFTLNDKKIEVMQFGHLYQFEETNFEEKSFYISCNKKTFHIKTLIQVEHVMKWSLTVKQITDSFKCD